MKSQMLTMPEVAEFFKCSKSSAYGLINCKAIPFVKLGKRNLVWSESLEEWIKQHEQKRNRRWE